MFAMAFNGSSWNYVGNRGFGYSSWNVIFEIIHGIPYLSGEPTLFCPYVSLQAFSPTIPTVEQPVPTIGLNIQPNPISGEILNAKIQGVVSAEVVGQVVDLNGRVLQEKEMHIGECELEIQFDIGDLPQGMYMFKVLSEKGIASAFKLFLVGR